MTRFRDIAGQFILLFLAAAAPAVLAQGPATPAMSVCQARGTVVAKLQRVLTGYWGRLNSTPTGIAFKLGELEFQAVPNHDGPNAYMVYAVPKKLFPPGLYTVDLKILGEATHKIWNADPRISYIEIDGRSPFAKGNLSNAGVLGLLWWLQDEKAAQAFANAINSLRLSARAYDASRGPSPVCFADKDTKKRFWAEFQERAATWRALPSRPPISDDVKQHRLVAEDALNQKQFAVAAAEYEAGLEINPLWPEGHFNAALLDAEMKAYEDASWHMRCYLELLPNAPDAQDARDQMLLWQGKAKQQAMAPAK